MNLEHNSNSPGRIQGTVINASFPRSGNRFLRIILSNYFGQCFVLYKHHSNEIGANPAQTDQLQLVNIIKTHDFKLVGRRVLADMFPEKRKYLVQIRHPLESIISYYEFALNFREIDRDDSTTWKQFLAGNLKYWKKFYKLWAHRPNQDTLIVTYDDLFNSTHKTAQEVVKFLIGESAIDLDKLNRAIESQVFLRYDGDPESRQKDRREIGSFRYFDERRFKKIEKSLMSKYLQPHKIKLLFH